jgi:hypothetical protein
MKDLPRVLLVSAFVIVAFDVLGSFGSIILGFSYSSLSIGSFIIYVGAGFFAAKYGGIKAGVLGGTTTAFVEATVGWAASWAIGPGRPPDGYTGAGSVIFAGVAVIFFGALFGLVGAGIGKLVRRKS